MKFAMIIFITSTLSLAAMANDSECGQLTVNNEGSFTLVENSSFAVDFTATGAIAQQLSENNGANVCVEMSSSRDEYGAPANEALSIISINR